MSYAKMSLEEVRECARHAKPRRDKYRKRLAEERTSLVNRRELTGESPLPASRPSEEMLADARRRGLAPRPIVAWLMGDPAPGQSALDKLK